VRIALGERAPRGLGHLTCDVKHLNRRTGLAAACALERRQRDFPTADITRRPLWVPSVVDLKFLLRCEHLEHVAVRISEIKPASATTVIDLHIVEGAGSAAISNALGADSVEDAVKLRFIDFEGVVVAL